MTKFFVIINFVKFPFYTGQVIAFKASPVLLFLRK